jgi:hypothetical protein
MYNEVRLDHASLKTCCRAGLKEFERAKECERRGVPVEADIYESLLATAKEMGGRPPTLAT